MAMYQTRCFFGSKMFTCLGEHYFYRWYCRHNGWNWQVTMTRIQYWIGQSFQSQRKICSSDIIIKSLTDWLTNDKFTNTVTLAWRQTNDTLYGVIRLTRRTKFFAFYIFALSLPWDLSPHSLFITHLSLSFCLGTTTMTIAELRQYTYRF